MPVSSGCVNFPPAETAVVGAAAPGINAFDDRPAVPKASRTEVYHIGVDTRQVAGPPVRDEFFCVYKRGEYTLDGMLSFLNEFRDGMKAIYLEYGDKREFEQFSAFEKAVTSLCRDNGVDLYIKHPLSLGSSPYGPVVSAGD